MKGAAFLLSGGIAPGLSPVGAGGRDGSGVEPGLLRRCGTGARIQLRRGGIERAGFGRADAADAIILAGIAGAKRQQEQQGAVFLCESLVHGSFG